MIELWNKVLLEPMINGLLVLSNAFGGNFGLAIIGLTLIINVIILPLTLRQIRSTKGMQTLQPKMKEIQKKYAKDKQKLQQETMKLYKESGVNPIGCAFPLLIQMPILIALYQSVIQTLAVTPENLVGLSSHMYSFSMVQEAVPPSSTFLGLQLAFPNFFLVLLIMATMWLSQKMSTSSSPDAKQQQMQSMMQWMMPLMFGFIFLNFPSGLALYIVVMNIFRMVVQRFVMGNWGGLATLIPAGLPFGNAADTQEATKILEPPKGKAKKEIEASVEESKVITTGEEGTRDGSSRKKRKKPRRRN